MIGDGIAVTCFNVANTKCEVLVVGVNRLFIGRIFIGNNEAGKIMAETMLDLRIRFDEWLADRSGTAE